MKYKVCFGSGVTVFPEKAKDKILEGKASLKEIKVLTALLSLEKDKRDSSEIAAMLSLTESETENALSFWRGAGIIETEDEASVPTVSNGDENVKTVEEVSSKKALLSEEMPSYTGEMISEMLGKDGGKLKAMIDECQQILGKILSSAETETMVALCDWLGLETDYVVMLCGYFSQKKPGCRVRYIEKAAVGLVNDGITTTEQLEEYIKNMELFDGVAGKLRLWLGIGARDFTKKENGTIKHWINDLDYGEDVIRKAYEVTVDSIGEFKFQYADSIMERWYKEKLRSVEEIEKHTENYKAAAASGGKGQATKGGSFETSEFFEAALRRSYENIGKKD